MDSISKQTYSLTKRRLTDQRTVKDISKTFFFLNFCFSKYNAAVIIQLAREDRRLKKIAEMLLKAVNRHNSLGKKKNTFTANIIVISLAPSHMHESKLS